MPNYPYHGARYQAKLVRFGYMKALGLFARRPIRQRRRVPLTVYSYSGESGLPEQVASLRSFLRHVGIPRRFIVVSDGSHSEQGLSILQQVHPCVETMMIGDCVRGELPPALRDYAARHPLGRKLSMLVSLPIDGPTLYTDSDVLFFAGAPALADLLEHAEAPAVYLPDCVEALDGRLLRGRDEALRPVNSGFLLVFRGLDWGKAVDRLVELGGEPDYFTEQTAVHLTMHHSGAVPFDSRRYVMRVDDQFCYADRYAARGIAMRHYVNPVRHKFWTTVCNH